MSLDLYYSGSEGEDYEHDDELDEEKTYEVYRSLSVKVKPYFESTTTSRSTSAAKRSGKRRLR